jgi:ribosomal 50S subunit-recycling heat shock protein
MACLDEYFRLASPTAARKTVRRGEVLVDGQVRKCHHVLKGGETLTWRVRKGAF